jgi:hypothetical protein
MLSKNPNLTPRQVDSILELYCVRDLGNPGKDDTFGAGRVNCSLAVAFTPLPTGIRTIRWTIDDAPPGGNGDGVIGPGETINLPIWVRNLNGHPTLGVWGYFRLSIPDPNVTLIDTIKRFGNIATDDSAYTGSSGFKFSVSVACTNDYGLPFTLVCRDTFDSTWDNPLGLRVGTASLVGGSSIVHDPPPGGNGNGRLDRGETADLEIGVSNIGGGNASNVTAHLISLDSRFQVLDSLGTYGDIRHDTTVFNSGDQYQVHADFTIPIEFQIPCSLRIFASGYSATRYVTIPCGVMMATDPIPDGPRTPALYYAYDDVDTFYTAHPHFNWIETRGRGTQLTLSDDQTVQVNLPTAFGSFRYYGTSYNLISVCGNGFIMPGSFSVTGWTNAGLPTTTLAAPAICACWDDLYPPTGGGVWWYHDVTNHAFVVEWDSVAYYSPRTTFDKFQIVLFDSTLRSYSNDNTFAYQYMTASGYTSNTVGNQNQSQTIGINALFDGAYHRACAPVIAGRAIRFTTDTVTTALAENPTPLTALRLGLFAVNNPFRGAGSIRFSLPAAAPVRLVVYDIGGRAIRSLLNTGNRPLEAGVYSARWDGCGEDGGKAANGVYFYRLETSLGTVARKAVKVD